MHFSCAPHGAGVLLNISAKFRVRTDEWSVTAQVPRIRDAPELRWGDVMAQVRRANAVGSKQAAMPFDFDFVNYILRSDLVALYVRRADVPGSRRRRGRDADGPRRRRRGRDADSPRRRRHGRDAEISVETGRGPAAGCHVDIPRGPTMAGRDRAEVAAAPRAAVDASGPNGLRRL